MKIIPSMRIPVFVSAPSADNLNDKQAASTTIIDNLLRRYRFEWRALGRSDYPNDVPLKEVRQLVQQCSGGIILGFEQFCATSGEWKRNSKNQKNQPTPLSFPTPWNQLEAGMIFSARLPMMIFRDKDVSGGIFDLGTSEVFIHSMPYSKMSRKAHDDLDSVFQRWAARVRTRYYGD